MGSRVTEASAARDGRPAVGGRDDPEHRDIEAEGFKKPDRSLPGGMSEHPSKLAAHSFTAHADEAWDPPAGRPRFPPRSRIRNERRTGRREGPAGDLRSDVPPGHPRHEGVVLQDPIGHRSGRSVAHSTGSSNIAFTVKSRRAASSTSLPYRMDSGWRPSR